jgi:hypothetical protein
MEIIIAFGSSVITSFVKRYIEPKFGKIGVQVLVFLLVILGVFIWRYISAIPEWKDIALKSLETLAYSIGMYEVVLKRLGFA